MQVFLKYNETYGCDRLIFTSDDLEEMKLREKTMSELTERGYYRSKQDHELSLIHISEPTRLV